MGLLETLSNLMQSGQVGDQQVDEMVKGASPDDMGSALASAFRDRGSTPPMGDMVGQLFDQSNDEQRAGLINQLLKLLGPAAAGALAGGVLGRVLSPGSTQVTPEQASTLSPDQVRDVVVHAEKSQPAIADELGAFYSRHSGLIKTLGGAALLIAAAKLKQNMEGRG